LTLTSFISSSNQEKNQIPKHKNFEPQKTQQPLKRSYNDMVAKLIEEAKQRLKPNGADEIVKDLNLGQHYRIYDEDQKDAILALTPYLKLSEIQAQFGVPVNTVKYWQTHGKTDKRKLNSGRKAPLMNLEKVLYDYFLGLRALGRPVNNHILRKKMMSLYADEQKIEVRQLELAQKFQKSINTVQSNPNLAINKESMFTPSEAQILRETLLKLGNQVFLLSDKWLQNFRKRYKITCRRITHIAKNIPEDLFNRGDDFLKTVFFLRIINEYDYELMINFDETPIFYDTIPTETYEREGVKQVNLKSGNA